LVDSRRVEASSDVVVASMASLEEAALRSNILEEGARRERWR
jgi:hypothetical protein